MKKRSFVLFELLIALSLVACFSLPLIRGHSLYGKKQRELLLDLEKERKAEALFFGIVKDLAEKHPLHTIGAQWKKNPFQVPNNSLTFDLGKLKKKTLFWHYHLYSNVDEKKSCRKLCCQICFTEKPYIGECDATQSIANAQYGFIITAKN